MKKNQLIVMTVKMEMSGWKLELNFRWIKPICLANGYCMGDKGKIGIQDDSWFLA